MADPSVDTKALQRGSAEIMVLSLLEAKERHGYELSKLIETQSREKLSFHTASLYPMLYRLEKQSLIQGRWVEKAGERRRRFYRLTPEGKKTLARKRGAWREFFDALDRVARFRHA